MFWTETEAKRYAVIPIWCIFWEIEANREAFLLPAAGATVLGAGP